MSAACDLDSGTCIAETALVYAAVAGSTTSSCTKVDPCTIDRAFSVADQSRPNIKLTPGTYTPNPGLNVTFSGTYTLSVYGPATTNFLALGGNGGGLRVRDVAITYSISCAATSSAGANPVLDLKRVSFMSDLSSGAVLGISQCQAHLDQVDVSISSANVGEAVDFSGNGIGTGSIVTIDRSRFTGGNPALQIYDQTSIAITNSIFADQGSKGAIAFQTGTGQTPSGTVSFSTFHNTVETCPSGNALISFSNNVFLNESAGAPSNTVSGTECSHQYDLIKPQAAAVGTTNLLGMDPRLVNAGSGDYHLMMGSPAIDAADPAATLSTDYDGTARPQGARSDIGAFEYKP